LVKEVCNQTVHAKRKCPGKRVQWRGTANANATGKRETADGGPNVRVNEPVNGSVNKACVLETQPQQGMAKLSQREAAWRSVKGNAKGSERTRRQRPKQQSGGGNQTGKRQQNPEPATWARGRVVKPALNKPRPEPKPEG